MSEFYDGTSSLVENMSQEAARTDSFPAIIGREITHFHEVGGGYDRENRQHVIELIHKLQGYGSPKKIDPNQASYDVEVHIDNYYNLPAESMVVVDRYPKDDYVMLIRVEDYMTGEHSFMDELQTNVDKRETRYG